VGWLAAAIPAGYLLYYVGRAFVVRLARLLAPIPWFVKHKSSLAILGLGLLLAIALVLIGLLLLGAWLEGHADIRGDRGFSLVSLLGDLESDTLARVIIGFTIGAGAAHFMHRPAISEGGTSIFERASAKTQALIVSVGGVLLAFALMAPYLDRWLSNAEDVTILGIEVKVGQAAKVGEIGPVEKFIVPELREAIFDDQVFMFIERYPTLIDQDIALITIVELMPLLEQLDQKPVPALDKRSLEAQRDETRRQIEQIDRVKRFVRTYLSPIAECAIRARYAGASLTDVQAAIRPVAKSLRVAMTMHLMENDANTWSEGFVHEVFSARENLIGSVGNQRGCPDIAPWQWHATGGAEAESILDTLRRYPYIYVALERLVVLEGDFNAASRILSLAEDLPFHDYSFYYYYASTLSQMGATIDQYIRYSDALLTMAEGNLKKIQEARAHCNAANCDQDHLPKELDKMLNSLEASAYKAKLYAMNQIASGAARDKAAGANVDQGIWDRAQDYAQVLFEASLKASESGIPASANDDQLYDTYAYVTLLTEAGKAKPDHAKLESIARKLRQITRAQESKITMIDKNRNLQNAGENGELLKGAAYRIELRSYQEHLKAVEDLLK